METKTWRVKKKKMRFTILFLCSVVTLTLSEDPLASTGITVHDKLDLKATKVVSSTEDIEPVAPPKTQEPTYVENVPFEVAVSAAEKKFDVFQSASDVRLKKMRDEISHLKSSIKSEIEKHVSEDDELKSKIFKEGDVIKQLTKTMEALKSKYTSAMDTVTALTETVDEQDAALKEQKKKTRSLRIRDERKLAKDQQIITAEKEKISMEESENKILKSDLKQSRKKTKSLKEQMEAQATEFRTKAEEAERLIESYKKERDETVHNLEVSNAKLRNMIDHSHLAASAFAKLVNERAYYKNLSEKNVEKGGEAGTEAGGAESGTESGAESASTESGAESAGTESGAESAGTESGAESAGTESGAESAGTESGAESAGAESGAEAGSEARR